MRRARRTLPTSRSNSRSDLDDAPRKARPSSSSSSKLGRTQANPLIGQRVRHATYGSGTIIGVEGDDEDRKLTVRFSDHGVKKLIERYANLQSA